MATNRVNYDYEEIMDLVVMAIGLFGFSVVSERYR